MAASSTYHLPTLPPSSMIKMLIPTAAVKARSISVDIISDTARSHCPRPPAPAATPPLTFRKKGRDRPSTGTFSPLPSIKSSMNMNDDSKRKDTSPQKPQHRTSPEETSADFCRWDSTSSDKSLQDTSVTEASRWNPLIVTSRSCSSDSITPSPPPAPLTTLPPHKNGTTERSDADAVDTVASFSKKRSSPPNLPQRRRQTTLDIIDQAMQETEVF